MEILDIELRKIKSLLSIISFFSILWCISIPFTFFFTGHQFGIFKIFTLPKEEFFTSIMTLVFLSISIGFFVFAIFGWTIFMQIKTLNYAFLFFIIANIFYIVSGHYSYINYSYKEDSIDDMRLYGLLTLAVSILLIFFYLLLLEYCNPKKKYWNNL